METTFFKTFDKNGSFEIGLKLLKSVGSRLGFFKEVGPQCVKKTERNTPSAMELLIMENPGPNCVKNLFENFGRNKIKATCGSDKKDKNKGSKLLKSL